MPPKVLASHGSLAALVPQSADFRVVVTLTALMKAVLPSNCVVVTSQRDTGAVEEFGVNVRVWKLQWPRSTHRPPSWLAGSLRGRRIAVVGNRHDILVRIGVCAAARRSWPTALRAGIHHRARWRCTAPVRQPGLPNRPHSAARPGRRRGSRRQWRGRRSPAARSWRAPRRQGRPPLSLRPRATQTVRRSWHCTPLQIVTRPAGHPTRPGGRVTRSASRSWTSV